MTDPRRWAGPTRQQGLTSMRMVYTADIDTAYRSTRPNQFGDQIIWKMTGKDPIRWIRVTKEEVAQSAPLRNAVIISTYHTKGIYYAQLV